VTANFMLTAMVRESQDCVLADLLVRSEAIRREADILRERISQLSELSFDNHFEPRPHAVEKALVAPRPWWHGLI